MNLQSTTVTPPLGTVTGYKMHVTLVMLHLILIRTQSHAFSHTEAFYFLRSVHVGKLRSITHGTEYASARRLKVA